MRQIAKLPTAPIDRLIWCRAIEAPIDPFAPRPQGGGRVDAPSPSRRAHHGEAIGMPRLNKRLARAIAELLSQVRADRRPRVMPYQSGRVERDLPIAIQHAPAKVDIVARDRVDRVETAQLLQCLSGEGHVTAGHMFRPVIGQEDVDRPARRGDNLTRPRRVRYGTFIRTAYAHD